MASDTVLLVGKIVFALALYGFIFAVFRGMMSEARRSTRVPVGAKPGDAHAAGPVALGAGAAGRPASAPRPASNQPVELRPPGAQRVGVATEAVTLRPAAPPVPPQPVPAPTVTVAPLVPVGAPAPVGSVPRPSQADHREAEAPKPPPVARLVVLTSPEASLTVGQRIDVKNTVRFGRGEENDFVLKDRFVSARHAEVGRSDAGYVLRDLGSTNGTFRNGMRIEGECPLSAGDRIGIGTSVFAFHEGG